MTLDPADVSATLSFLASDPPPLLTCTPAKGSRRAMLEDCASALEFFHTNSWAAGDTSACRAARQVFELAAHAFQSAALSLGPDRAAVTLHAFAVSRLSPLAAQLPPPLADTLADSFPQVSAWAATVTVCGALSPADVGRLAAWWAVGHLAALAAGPGFEDGEPEDVLQDVLQALEAPGRVLH